MGVVVAAASHSWLYAALQVRLAKKLHPNVLELIQPSLLYTGLILAALGFLGRRLAAQMRGRTMAIATFALAAAIVPTLVLRWYTPLKLLAETDSSRRLAATILASPERDSPIFGYYYFRTSLPFYLRRPVGLLPIEWGEMTSNYQVAHQAEARRMAGGQSGQGSAGHAPRISRPDEIKLAAHSGDDPERLGGRPLGERGAHRPALE